MTGGVEGDMVVVNNSLLAPIERFDFRGFDAVALDKNVASAGRAKHALVSCKMVGVAVRDKRKGPWPMGIKPHFQIGKVERFGIKS